MQDNYYKEFAARIRMETVKEIGVRGFGHIGGSLSIVDLFAVLYGGLMNIDTKNPSWEERDRLVMSKGHAGPALYATLALKGFFPMDWLETLNQPNTHLPSHCDRFLTPGIDMTTGSLGQGVSMAIGLALGQKKRGYNSYTYLISGDGELNEGQCWEGALFAPTHKLDNLIWFVDYNHKQLDGRTEEIIDLMDIAEKFKTFGWNAVNINGNDTNAINDAIKNAKSIKDIPSCIVLNTIKGAGVPCIESIGLNHHLPIDSELLKQAIAECEASIASLEGSEE